MGRILAAIASLLGMAATPSAHATKAEPGPLLAMVALGSDEIARPEALTEYLNNHWSAAGPFEVGDKEAESEVITVTAPGGILLFVTHIDAPIPAAELQYPCETSLGWQDACNQLKRMKGHAIVASMSPGHMDAGAQVFLLSILAQAVAARSKGIGVYVGDADSVWSAQLWEALTLPSSKEQPPYFPWIGPKAQANDDGTVSVVTRGMPSFNHMNVEAQNAALGVEVALEFVVSVATYLISSGVVINDGDTIGASAEEKIKVTYGPSMLDGSTKVYQLHF